MKRLSLFIAMCFVLIVSSGCYAAGPWKGKVVDAQTKQPIEGAAVVAVWSKSYRGPAGLSTGYLDARETVTDNDGKFEIESFSALDVPFFREISGPLFTIYKPGYGSYPSYQVSPEPPIPYETIFEKNEDIVELPVFTDNKERRDAMNAATPSSYVPRTKVKQLMKLINYERVSLGFEPYPEPVE